MTTYPVHTPIMNIQNFDRSIKVEIQCPNHPENKWHTKDPHASRWFPDHTNVDKFGNVLHDCDCPMMEFETSTEYTA